MAGPYITTGTLLDAIAQGLKKGDAAALKPYWTPIAVRCVERGWRDIRNALAGKKGYTEAQLDGWDDRVSYNLDQSLFWAYIEGGGPADQAENDIKALDHRKELAGEDFLIAVNGVYVTPGAEVGSGANMAAGDLTIQAQGIDYGTTFGLGVFRDAGSNEYGDTLRQW